MWMPKVNSDLTVDLPGERTRATVKKIVDKNTVIVQLTTMPMAKSHHYRFNDVVAARRTQLQFAESWVVIEERHTLPEAMEKKNAPPAGIKPDSKINEHQRADPKRTAAGPGRGDRAKQRAPAPARRGGARGS